MASTYTANSGIEKIGAGEQAGAWGTTTNNNLDILDRAINGVGAITLSGTTHTLTTSDGTLSEGGNKVLVLGGSPSGTNTITISPNDQDEMYFVHNNSGQTATFTQGSGTWRSHYHALLHGLTPEWIENKILQGKSISLCNLDHNFYSSAIVTGVIPIALGTAIGLKRQKSKQKVWCFVGDMTFETGIFYEVHKYARNFNLPLYFVVEDNGVSTQTPTKATWNNRRDIPDDVIHYEYKSKYPHYGTGKWVIF